MDEHAAQLNNFHITSQAIDGFVRSKKLSGKWTKKSETGYLMHLESFKKAAPTNLEEINREFIETYLGEVGAGKKGKPAPYMKRGSFMVLKIFFNWCIGQDFITDNPMKRVEIGKPIDRIRPIPSKDHLRLILNYLRGDKSFLGKRNYALIMCFANSGCRLSELLADNNNDRTGLLDSNINWNKGELTVFGKGEKERLVGVQKNTLEAMHNYNLMAWKRWPAKKTLAFWLTEEGRPLQGGGFREAFKRLCKKFDFPYSPHDWRRFFCTNIAESGMNDTQGMLLTGHRSHEMYEKYNKNCRVQTALAELEKHSPVAGL